MTGVVHEGSHAVELAAEWLANTPRHERNRPAVPLLQERFGLTAQEACQAIEQANLKLARAQ
jgi:hypothetical protein